jgi:hypothetical protein
MFCTIVWGYSQSKVEVKSKLAAMTSNLTSALTLNFLNELGDKEAQE